MASLFLYSVAINIVMAQDGLLCSVLMCR